VVSDEEGAQGVVALLGRAIPRDLDFEFFGQLGTEFLHRRKKMALALVTDRLRRPWPGRAAPRRMLRQATRRPRLPAGDPVSWLADDGGFSPVNARAVCPACRLRVALSTSPNLTSQHTRPEVPSRSQLLWPYGQMAIGGEPFLRSSTVSIDQASFEPVYRQLARILRESVQAGELRAGEALPSEAALSQRYGVGRDAVRDALSALRGEGLVITTRGVGTFVRGPVDQVTVVLVGTGTRVSARVPTADERLALGVPEGTAVLVVSRAGKADQVLAADRTVIEVEE
jgi:DNA-binding transcriptional regulator YhcF (GntR family)